MVELGENPSMGLSAPKKAVQVITLQDVSKTLGELSRRVRTLEEKLDAARERLDIVDDSMHDLIEKLKEDTLELNEKISEINSVLTEFKTTIQQIIKQLGVFAHKSDLKALEKYVDIMDPSRYLTEEQIIELIRKERIGKRKKAE